MANMNPILTSALPGHTAAQAPGTTEPFPHSPHQQFVEAAFAENGSYGNGVLTVMFRVFSRTLATYLDFDIGFHFARGEWHIRVKPKTSLGKLAIQQLKEATIQGELSKGVV